MEIEWLIKIALLIGAYLLGAVPFGLLLGRVAGVDVRREGSGNIGATNVGRLLGKKLGLLTLAADMLKGVLPMLLAGWLLVDGDQRSLLVLACGAAAFIGHIFPIYLGFKGGKGVATALGVFLYLAPLAALGAMAVFALVLLNWGYVSLASLSAAFFIPGLIWLFYGTGLWGTGLGGTRQGAESAPGGGATEIEGLLNSAWSAAGPECLLALVVAALIWWKHRDNISRLLQGKEKSWHRPER